MPDTTSTTRYQCRHIFTDGRRCASPCLRQEEFCYYHHTTRKPVENPRQRRSRRSTFELPLPDSNDRSCIQSAIGHVLRRIASNDIDPRRAGLLLYGLQIASINLPKPKPTAKPTRRNSEEPAEEQTVEEITTDPNLGVLAPRTEITKPEEYLSTVGRLLKKMASSEPFIDEPTKNELPTQPTILPTLNAESTEPISNPTPQMRVTPTEPRAQSRGSGGPPHFAFTFAVAFLVVIPEGDLLLPLLAGLHRTSKTTITTKPEGHAFTRAIKHPAEGATALPKARIEDDLTTAASKQTGKPQHLVS